MKQYAGLAAGLFLFSAMAFADTPVPATVEFNFTAEGRDGIRAIRTGETPYFKTIQRSGGEIENGRWHVGSSAPFGQGILQFELDRAQVEGDRTRSADRLAAGH